MRPALGRSHQVECVNPQPDNKELRRTDNCPALGYYDEVMQELICKFSFACKQSL